MEYFLNSNIEKQTIYEIYRACRLCGAGAGYKMPIIQNVVNLDTNEVELKQKIRECVQIEVHQDDKMPPLICELCVDKVNDFYEFFEMCRQTNMKTRLRLGLPPQKMPRGAPDAGDCILGITEPVFINDNCNEDISTRNRSCKGSSSKKHEHKVKIEKGCSYEMRESRSSTSSSSTRSSRRQPSPPRLRGTKRRSEDDISLSNLVEKTRSHEVQKPKSILKKEVRVEIEECSMVPNLKRLRERDTGIMKEKDIKQDVIKRVKISLSPPKSMSAKSLKPSRSTLPQCKVCKLVLKSTQALSSHVKVHNPGHKRAPDKKSSPKPEPKTIECSACGKHFSRLMLRIHKCAQRGGHCGICNRNFSTDQALSRHVGSCRAKKKEYVVKPSLMRHVKPFQVRVARCDPLLKHRCGDYYDVSEVAQDYGLDKNCVYPYISSVRRLKIKMEPHQYDNMVKINDEIRREFDLDENYVHWDSDDSSDSDLEVTSVLNTFGKKNNVDRLSTLSIKTIFSKRFLGKVPKKLRKLKNEAPFDSILNNTDFDCDMRRGIDNIIDSLGDDTAKEDDTSFTSKDLTNEKCSKKNDDNDSLFGDEPDTGKTVTNNDFDSLLFSNEYNDSSALRNSKMLEGDDIENCKKSDESNLHKDTKSSENDSIANDKKNDIDKDACHDSTKVENICSIDYKTNSDLITINDVSKSVGDNNDTSLEEKNTVHAADDDLKTEVSMDQQTTDSKQENSSESIAMSKKIESFNGSKDSVEQEESVKENSDNVINDKVLGDSLQFAKKERNPTVDDQVNAIESNLSNDSDIKEKLNNEVCDNEIKAHNDINETKSESECTAEIKDILLNTNKHNDKDIDTKDNGDGAIEIKSKNLVKTCINGDIDMDKFSMDDLEDISDTEMDDRKLMEALDAQIGENEKKTTSCNPTEKDRHKSNRVDLENISDGNVDG